MTKDMLRIAVIGAGRIGKVHARTVATHPSAELVLVADPVASAAQALAAPYGARVVHDPHEVFQDESVDAVVIGSPTALHAEHVLAAARAGKAVLCEKPLAPSVAEARGLVDELGTFDHPPVMLGFQRRFDPTIAKAKRLAEEGSVGDIQQVVIVSRDPAPAPLDYLKTSGGIYADMSIHDFDEARFFLGDIASVTAVGQNYVPEIAEFDYDASVVLLRASNGAVATIHNSRGCASGYDQRLEVFGAKGTLTMDNLRPTALRVSTAAFSDAQDPYLDFFLERYADAYRDELTAFIDAVLAGQPVSPTVADGLAAQLIAQAALESARTGTTVNL